MSSAEETPDYKKIAELVTPPKHLCIKCKQQLARVGLVCDSCFIKLNHLIAEFNSMKEKGKKPLTGDNS
jgi:predicted amidophosphoribosyltransferase